MDNYDNWKLATPEHYDDEPTLECANCEELVFETNGDDLCEECAEKIKNRKIDYSTIEIDGIDTSDYPKFCDAYISSAQYDDGEECSDEDLDKLNDNEGELIHEKVMNILF